VNKLHSLYDQSSWINLLKPKRYYTTRFKIQKSCIRSTLYLRVF